jgi:hypothetical protein
MLLPILAADLVLRAAFIADAIARDWRVALSPRALSRAGSWAGPGDTLHPPPLTPSQPRSWRDLAMRARG